jgi:hypothetical protein
MSVIMNGFKKNVVLDNKKEGKRVHVNTFLYQGNHFEAFLSQGLSKDVYIISLNDIVSFEKKDHGYFVIRYGDGNEVRLKEE